MRNVRDGAWLGSFAFALAFGASFCPAAYAAVLSVGAGVSGSPGDTVDIPIEADDATGAISYSFELSFDTGALSFVSASNGTLTTDAGWGAPSANAPGSSVLVAAAEATALSGGGSLVILKFQIVSGAPSGGTALAFVSGELNDVAVTTQDGTVTVIGGLPAVIIPYYSHAEQEESAAAHALSPRVPPYEIAVLVLCGLVAAAALMRGRWRRAYAPVAGRDRASR